MKERELRSDAPLSRTPAPAARTGHQSQDLRLRQAPRLPAASKKSKAPRIPKAPTSHRSQPFGRPVHSKARNEPTRHNPHLRLKICADLPQGLNCPHSANLPQSDAFLQLAQIISRGSLA